MQAKRDPKNIENLKKKFFLNIFKGIIFSKTSIKLQLSATSQLKSVRNLIFLLNHKLFDL